jgi:D-xylose-binding periplasmic protein
MTVYKPIKTLAEKAAEIAIKLGNGETIESNGEVNNGKINVKSYLLDPISVTNANIKETVIKDGFQSESDVYGK